MTRKKRTPSWIASLSACLTHAAFVAHAVVLVLCLWGVCAVDYSTPGIFDRAGNIKFQDFLPLYISGPADRTRPCAINCYDAGDRRRRSSPRTVVGGPPQLRLPYLYGPQVGLVVRSAARTCRSWSPLASGSLSPARLLRLHLCSLEMLPQSAPCTGRLVTLAAIAFPPLFHFFVRGQTLGSWCWPASPPHSSPCKQIASWLAGVALGFLFFKPQFLVAIPLVLLLAHAWKILIGMVLSVSAQLAFARVYFGPTVVRAYFDMLRHSSRWIDTAEGSLAPIQMHSLRSFFSLLIPWPAIAFALYVLSSICVVWLASRVWKSQSSVALRFSALTLAAVLINPHLFVYDLLVMAPAFLLLTDWSLQNSQHPAKPALDVLLYLAFLLPLFGPLAHWTHLQVSVVVFVAIMWILHRIATASHKLAFAETGVV